MKPGLRRRIEIRSRMHDQNTGEARAVLEDDYHHFRVAISHTNNALTGINGWSLRYPFISCPAASNELLCLVGQSLSEVSTDVYRQTSARIHCTHMLDLAGFAIAAAARKITKRTYTIAIADRVNKITDATLHRDGSLLLKWKANMDAILSPTPYTGVSYRVGFSEWARTHLSIDEAEAALAMRRAMIISIGRTKNLDAQVHATPLGNCYSQQPVRAEKALRVRGSTLDFTNREDELCVDDTDWLAFKAD